MPPRLVRALVLLATCHIVACSPSSTARPDIVMIVIDTLRFDRLGSYGSQRGLTPFLDSLAQRAYVFEHAYAQTSWTNPSVASLYTSRYQSQHGVISFGSTLPETELTLAEILKQNGYATGAFNANFLLLGKLGFGQGFDHFQLIVRPDGTADGRSRFRKGRADEVNEATLAWIDEVSGGQGSRPPLFLYLQYMEPHAPFDPPERHLDRVLNGRPRPDLEAVNESMGLAVVPFEDDMVQAVVDYYDAEILALDSELRNLFAGLEKRGILDNALIVITADHGEELNEHGIMGHHQSLYEEVIRVPLLLLVPGKESRTDISALVSLIDVAPTLLDLTGIAIPERFEGRSLAQVFDVGEPPSWRAKWQRMWNRGEADAPAFSELIKAEGTLRLTPHERAVVANGDKLIVGVKDEREYYDLGEDPRERQPQQDTENRARLDAALQRLYAYAPDRAAVSSKAALDPETRERMRLLGYQE